MILSPPTGRGSIRRAGGRRPGGQTDPISTALALAISSAAVILAALLGARSSARAARELDGLARRRSREREGARIRAAAAFIRADLDVCSGRLREVMEDDE